MKILITGICGFVGSSLALGLKQHDATLEIAGLDNLIRPGSETNRPLLRQHGIAVRHADVRLPSDFEGLPTVDWVIDAAANPSVLAGLDGQTSARQLLEHNLLGTINLLEYCRRTGAGCLLLSTSRVYSIRHLAQLPVVARAGAFQLATDQPLPPGLSARGIAPEFPTTPPVSLYGATKLASETLALEYAAAFAFPLWINRCGVLAGAGQFGTAEQGIFSYWIHAYAGKRPLRYLGFQGTGPQVRDALHPADLTTLVWHQLSRPKPDTGTPILNVGGGPDHAMSLRQLTDWCADQFGGHSVASDDQSRPFDVPWVVMDNTRVTDQFGWKPERSLESILEEIAVHARQNPHWLEMTGAK